MDTFVWCLLCIQIGQSRVPGDHSEVIRVHNGHRGMRDFLQIREQSYNSSLRLAFKYY